MKCAVIGGGHIGRRHAHNFARLGYDVAVYDVVPNRGTVARWSEAVEGADLVVIATPPSQHVTDVMAALDVGARWLLVEKPLATSAAEADGLQHAALAAGAHVYVGYCLRFALATLQLKDAIARIAPVRVLEAVYSEQGPLERQPWLTDPAEGGVLLEHSHMLDLLLQMFGMPLDIDGFAYRDECCASLRWYADELGMAFEGTLRMDFWSPHETRLKVIGERGVVEWRREYLEEPDQIKPAWEDPSAWLLHEAQELHTLRMTGESNNRLCTMDEAIRVLDFAERLR